MQPAPSPIHSIPLPAAASSAPTIQFNSSNTQVLISYQIQKPIPQSFWRLHGSDITGSLALITGFLFLYFFLRILPRSQKFGHIYCPRCNYDLTPPPRDPGVPPEPLARCPECGNILYDEPPIPGRSPRRAPFLTKLTFLCMFICMISLSTCSSLVAHTHSPIGWPFAALGNLSWWPLSRPAAPTHPFLTFESYSLSTLQPLGSTTLDTPTWATRPSPDHRYLAGARFANDKGKDDDAFIIDLSTGRERLIDFGIKGSPRFQGFTPDAKEMIYTVITRPTPDHICTIHLFCVTIDPLVPREIFRLQSSSTPLSDTGFYTLPSLVAAVGNTPEQWALVSIFGAETGKLYHGLTGNPSSPPTSIQLNLPSTFFAASTLEFIGRDTIRFDSAHTISLSRGTISPLPPPTPATIRAVGAKLEITLPDSTKRLIPSTLPLASLTPTPAPITISPDGHWAYFLDTTSPSPPAAPTTNLILIDLSKKSPSLQPN